MPARLSWSNLVPGLIALLALALVAVAVLTFGGVGKVRGETVRFIVLTDQARGLMPGSEVWLDGQKVGTVDHVSFRPPSADTLFRVAIAVDVLEDEASRVRQDSRVRVRSGGSVIGPVVVYLESGTPSAPPIGAGDTIRALAQADAETVVAALAPATEQLPALVADVKTVMGHLNDRDGTVGALRSAEEPRRQLNALRRNVATLRARFGGTAGTPGPRDVARRASLAMARVDSLRALLASDQTSLGRFRKDSTLARRIGDIGEELGALQRDMEASRGTLWRWQHDSALVRSIADARAEMALLFADVKRHPLRYLHF